MVNIQKNVKNDKIMERDENVRSIEVRLAEAKREVRKAEDKVHSISEELRAAMQQVFEQRLGVKSGDIITSIKSNTKYCYEKFLVDVWGNVCVLCHPIKKDGTPSKAIRHIFYGEFIACI